jgi:hypothetical protein
VSRWWTCRCQLTTPRPDGRIYFLIPRTDSDRRPMPRNRWNPRGNVGGHRRPALCLHLPICARSGLECMIRGINGLRRCTVCEVRERDNGLHHQVLMFKSPSNIQKFHRNDNCVRKKIFDKYLSSNVPFSRLVMMSLHFTASCFHLDPTYRSLLFSSTHL